jgi:hypothetical protein
MKRLEPLIEKIIYYSYKDNIFNVEFRNKEVYLGSSPELPEEERTINQTVIIITLNNLDSKFQNYELKNMRREIINKIDSIFILNYMYYGSKWDFEFKVAEINNLL